MLMIMISGEQVYRWQSERRLPVRVLGKNLL
jgi:hypothetical protein